MDDAVLVRPATQSDAEAVARLSAILGYPAAVETVHARVRAILGSGSDLLAVAEAGERVVGWLQAHAAHRVHAGWVVEIVGLVVAPEARRRGIGRRLVVEAERWAAARSAGALTVRANLRRSESHLFYPALGFALTKTQAVYRLDLGGHQR